MTSVRIQRTPRGTTVRLNGREVTSLVELDGLSIEWQNGVPVVAIRVPATELLVDLDGAEVVPVETQKRTPRKRAKVADGD